jgi:hypothetical protein
MTETTSQAVATATAAITDAISEMISYSYRMRGQQMQLTEPQFRRIIAGYFEQKTLKDWCDTFGVEPTENDEAASNTGKRFRAN